MPNPFANLQPAHSNRSLEVLTISNISSLSRIMPAPSTIDMSRDFSRYVTSATGGYNLGIFATESDELINEIKPIQEKFEYDGFQLNRDGTKFLYHGNIYECSTGKIIGKVLVEKYNGIFIPDWDFNFYYLIEYRYFKGTNITCYNTSTSGKVWSNKLENYTTNYRFYDISVDNSFVAMSDNSRGECTLIDTKKCNLKHVIKVSPYSRNVRFSLDSQSFFTENTIWSTDDGKVVYKNDRFLQMIANIDSTLLFVVDKDGLISIYDAQNWSKLNEIEIDYLRHKTENTSLDSLYQRTSIDISSDGKRLLVIHPGGKDIWGVISVN